MSKLEQVVHPLSKTVMTIKILAKTIFMCTTIQNLKGQTSDNFVMAN